MGALHATAARGVGAHSRRLRVPGRDWTKVRLRRPPNGGCRAPHGCGTIDRSTKTEEGATTTTRPPTDAGSDARSTTPDIPSPDDLFLPPSSARSRARALAGLVVNARALAHWSGVTTRAFGGSRLAAVRRLQRLRRRGFVYDDAVRLGLLDPAIGDDVLSGYASRHVALIAQRQANPDSFQDLTTQKAIFYRYCAAVGLPTPRLIAIIHRDTCGWGAGDRVVDSGGGLAALLAEHPVDLVAKPSDGGKGVGVRVFRRDAGMLVDEAGALSPEDLWEILRSDPDHRCYVIQERMRNREDLAALAPGPALNTIRLVTLVTRSGSREVVQAAIRLGLGGGVTDNFGDGSAGNGIVELDPATGRMGPLLVARPDGCGFVATPTVPSSGIRIEGVELPGWREALELAYSATGPFLPLRCVGWDIAITTRGPVLVEANREWTPGGITAPDLAGRLARIVQA